jgi:hypothetical protein
MTYWSWRSEAALDRDGLARLERLFGLGLSTEKSWRIGSAGAPRRSGPAHILELELAAIMQKVTTGPSMKQPVAFR